MAHRRVVVSNSALSPSHPHKILGRRKREVLLTDLPDDILIKIIHHALQMNPRLPGEISRRVCVRFQTLGLVIAQLSHRLHDLLRKSITSLQLTSRPPHTWLNAMLVFANRSLSSLHLTIDDSPSPQYSSKTMKNSSNSSSNSTSSNSNSQPHNPNHRNNSSTTARRTLRPDDDENNASANNSSISPHLSTPTSFVLPSPLHASRLCLMLASTRPPLRVLAISSLSPAPYEHVVSMLLALPALREVDLATPRPVDVAAIVHACPHLSALSLGRVGQYREVDEMRRQFTRLVSGRVSKTLVTLNIPWCCASIDAFSAIGKHCKALERLAIELGAMHWINHRTYIAWKQSIKLFEIDLAQFGSEQRKLLQTILSSVSDGRLRSFALRTLDGIAPDDLDALCTGLKGLTELDLFVGAPSHARRLCPAKTFSALERTLGKSLKRVNVVGIRFSAAQIERLAKNFRSLQALSVWIERYERPSVDVFSALGERIRHLSLLCDWDASMCAAVAKHNTKLESLFLVTTSLSVESISNLLNGVRSTLNDFRLFFNHKDRNGSGPPFANDMLRAQRNNDNDDAGEEEYDIMNIPQPQLIPRQNAQPEAGNEVVEPSSNSSNSQSDTAVIVMDVARLVAKGCSANLEVLNVSAVPRNGDQVVDCTKIALELRRIAPHLYQICDGFLSD